MATAAGGRWQEELDPRAKNAIRGAFLGFFVDMFDIYLPIVVLAPAVPISCRRSLALPRPR